MTDDFTVIRLPEFPIAGYKHHVPPEVGWKLAGSGSDKRVCRHVSLRAEPENPQDSHAVAVYLRNHRIGYLPSSSDHGFDLSQIEFAKAFFLAGKLSDDFREQHDLPSDRKIWYNAYLEITISVPPKIGVRRLRRCGWSGFDRWNRKTNSWRHVSYND